MKTIIQILIITFAIFLVAVNPAFAEQYPDKVVEKLGTGLANAVTGVAEIPKTISIVGNQDGVIHGMTVGFITGIANAVGRSLSGAFDIATFLIPTTPFVKPAYIWDDFSRKTTFVEAQMR
ncbi:putative exosortase-associated protein, TIGR04073 family [Nitrosomonas ureae]|uniref:Putative exosortase-associated protein, TIGR04073 family n=1 Tax=Nitrosomonas ureae TaxID=44577 RepID=A0A285BUC5_9PROT|nr:exosortase system-associated protein, TIGR04073 family [Nitrosomonas ureae]SNX58695.1 putative exosortase-associated protein, TIGR04073 family [Nitrosomonas ureae]